MTAPRPGGLLAVHAHPDDETLSTGALLATWASAGRPVTVVTCTRGERGEVIPAELAHLEGDGPALARHREGELAGALAALGVQDHVFLDAVSAGGATPGCPAPAGTGHRYEDSGMAWVGVAQAGAGHEVPAGAFVTVPVDRAARQLVAVLRARRPDVVVTYEPGGGYGHPDHVRTHQVTTAAVDRLRRAGEPVPVVLWAVQDGAALRRGYAALATVAPGVRRLPDPDGPVPSAATGHVDLAVDVAPVRDGLLAALRAHATQVQAVRAVDGEPTLVGHYALSDGLLTPVLPVESYRYADDEAAPADGWPAGVRPVA